MKTNRLKDFISSLKAIEKHPQHPSYVENFERIVSQIRELKEPKSILLLLQFLSDKSEELHLMWSIIHAIEIFDDSIYVTEILNASNYLISNSPEWASIIFMRIINSDESKVELIRQLNQSSLITKKSVKQIMETINNESPEFLAKTTPILIATSL